MHPLNQPSASATTTNIPSSSTALTARPSTAPSTVHSSMSHIFADIPSTVQSSTTQVPGTTGVPSTVQSSITHATTASSILPSHVSSVPHLESGPKPNVHAGISKSVGDLLSHFDLPKKLRREAPSRSVVHHHHHHHISVNSDSDLHKLHIDENKVNYLSYHPPVAVSQKGLIQSIGKPFSKNHAKYLPDPGDEFMLTRRASEVRLKHVKLYGDVNAKAVDSLAASINLFSVLIGISGIIFFGYIIAVACISCPMEFTKYYLDSHVGCKITYIVGVVHPIAVAPYCHYALINLKHIRTYFLRVPLSLIIQLAVIYWGHCQTMEILKPNQGEFITFLTKQMSLYHETSYGSYFARNTWDGIQRKFECCGYETPVDWNNYHHNRYPSSCCPAGSNFCNSTSHPYPKGCKDAYYRINLLISGVFVVLGILIITLQTISVLLMKSMYRTIGAELYDERSSLSIMWGKMCSLCDIETTDAELEYDEDHNVSDVSSSGDEIGYKQSGHSIRGRGGGGMSRGRGGGRGHLPATPSGTGRGGIADHHTGPGRGGIADHHTGPGIGRPSVNPVGIGRPSIIPGGRGKVAPAPH